MLIDLQLVSKNTNYAEYDFLIIGAGVAGTVLAKSLVNSGKKIALIEGGGSELTELSQNSYKGFVTGDPYYDLDVTRLRFFGGSSNHWAGMSRSFEKIDFEREYLGNIYKWPIKFNDMYDCMNAGYEKSISKMEEIGRDDVNKYEIFIRFACAEKIETNT